MDDAVARINLLTYDGSDPRLTEEPVCQICLAKQSEITLQRCPNCSVVWFCSECCSPESRDHQHSETCSKIVMYKNRMESCERKLMEEHNVNVKLTNGQNGQRRALSAREVRKANKIQFSSSCAMAGVPRNAPLPACLKVPFILANFSEQAYLLSLQLHYCAVDANTRELHEAVLDLCVVNLRLVSHNSSPHHLPDVAVLTAFTLVHLNRLDDAFCFIRDYMACQAKSNLFHLSKASPCLHEFDGEPDSRYNDCLDWMQSSLIQAFQSNPRIDAHDYWTRDEGEQEDYFLILLCLLIIKLRVHVPAAPTSLGAPSQRHLLPNEKGFNTGASLSSSQGNVLGVDDHENLEQIRGLMVMITVLYDKGMYTLIDHDRRWSLTLRSRWPLIKLFSLGPLGITPDARELLSAEFRSPECKNKLANETLADDIVKNQNLRLLKKALWELFKAIVLFRFSSHLYHFAFNWYLRLFASGATFFQLSRFVLAVTGFDVMLREITVETIAEMEVRSQYGLPLLPF